MFDTVTQHAETLGEHKDQLDAHQQLLKQQAEEISILKSSDAEIMQELKSIKTDFTNLENTIWKTAQSTQDVMKQTTDNLWIMLGKKEENKHEIQKTKLKSFWEFMGKLTMAGGLLAVTLELLFGK